MARSSVEFFAVLKSFETTTPATPCFPSLLFRRLKMGFFTEETLRMSFFLGTTRMLLIAPIHIDYRMFILTPFSRLHCVGGGDHKLLSGILNFEIIFRDVAFI